MSYKPGLYSKHYVILYLTQFKNRLPWYMTLFFDHIKISSVFIAQFLINDRRSRTSQSINYKTLGMYVIYTEALPCRIFHHISAIYRYRFRYTYTCMCDSTAFYIYRHRSRREIINYNYRHVKSNTNIIAKKNPNVLLRILIAWTLTWTMEYKLFTKCILCYVFHFSRTESVNKSYANHTPTVVMSSCGFFFIYYDATTGD